ncbi:hypothetical protein [Cohnella sp. GCM10027633]|uniref:hypothetical protein n=1 Tax=unclassified Cohnella TaxID=2636738 RepID=UPI003642D127
MKNLLTVIFVLILLLQGQGCSTGIDNRDGTIESTEEDLFNEMEKKATIDIGNVTEFNVNEIKYFEQNHIFLAYTFVADNTSYEGSGYAVKSKNRYVIKRFEQTKRDTKSPITKLQVIGDLDESLKRRYEIISGTVNDPRITTIIIRFSDLTNNIFSLTQTKRSYLTYSVSEKNHKLEQLIGLDKHDNEVFSQLW